MLRMNHARNEVRGGAGCLVYRCVYCRILACLAFRLFCVRRCACLCVMIGLCAYHDMLCFVTYSHWCACLVNTIVLIVAWEYLHVQPHDIYVFCT